MLEPLHIKGGPKSGSVAERRTLEGSRSSILASSAAGYLQLVRLGAGVTPSYPLHAVNAVNSQLRLDYDTDNYTAFTVGSGGDLE